MIKHHIFHWFFTYLQFLVPNKIQSQNKTNLQLVIHSIANVF